MIPDTIVSLATIIGASAGVLSYLHTRGQRRQANQRLQATLTPAAADDPDRQVERSSLTFRQTCRIEPGPKNASATDTKFQAVDLSPDGRLVATVTAGRRRARIFSAASGELVAVLPTPWLTFAAPAERERCLFHPQFERTETIAYVREQNHGVWLYQLAYSRGFVKMRELRYSESDDGRLLGAAGWSSTGAYFGAGIFSYGEHGRSYVIWDASNGAVVSRQPLQGSTEAKTATWHSQRELVFVHHSEGGAVIDVAADTTLDLMALSADLSYILSAAWHPTEALLFCATWRGFIVVDIGDRSVRSTFNDVEAEVVPIQRQYRLKMGADYKFSNAAAARLAFNPDGTLLATSDRWGNVVVRHTQDLAVQSTYWVDSSPGGTPTVLHWLASDAAGLVVQCYDEDRTLLTYFVDAQTSARSAQPELLSPLENGEYVWGAKSGVAAFDARKIVVYAYR